MCQNNRWQRTMEKMIDQATILWSLSANGHKARFTNPEALELCTMAVPCADEDGASVEEDVLACRAGILGAASRDAWGAIAF